jgi:hypothetical protein
VAGVDRPAAPVADGRPPGGAETPGTPDSNTDGGPGAGTSGGDGDVAQAVGG